MTDRPFDLVYYIWNEMLVGNVAGQSFSIRAASGGGRGRTGSGEERSFESFSPHRATNKKTHIRGGVIPPGLWRIELPSKYTGSFGKPVSKLTPVSNQVSDYATREYVNAPFLIHGPGEKGSDGCIVIEKVERRRLLSAVEKAGGATLLVSSVSQKGDLFDKNLQFRCTA